jgi:hypothetical protein
VLQIKVSSRAHAGLYAAQGSKNSPHSSYKRSTFQSVITINYAKFPEILRKIAIDAIIIKTVFFTLLHNMFTVLPVGGHDMSKRSEVNFNGSLKYEDL